MIYLMKNLKSIVALAIVIAMNISVFAYGQNITWVKQVLTANSGKFEFSPPYQDFVSLQTFNPLTQVSNDFGTIYTQSAQDICVSNHFAYVAAQDSIIKYNLNTLSRVAAVADSGLNKLLVMGNRLLVSKQYPIVTNFFEVLDTADLSLIAQVEGISGDCGGIAVLNDTVYVAVNGGWMGTEGKLAIIETSGWTFVREINFGTEAIGIMQIYPYGDRIVTVNKSPYSIPDQGSITIYDPAQQNFINTLLNVNVGNATGIKGKLLYLCLNYGIGTIDLDALAIADTTIISDPGSAFFTYITSSAIDTINNRLYVNTGDYFSNGVCLIASLDGDSITSYSTGVSSDAVVMDYRESPAGMPGIEMESGLLTVFPNPAIDHITLLSHDLKEIKEITITDVMGKTVYQKDQDNINMQVIPVRHLSSGIYCLIVKTQDKTLMKKFIKQSE